MVSTEVGAAFGLDGLDSVDGVCAPAQANDPVNASAARIETEVRTLSARYGSSFISRLQEMNSSRLAKGRSAVHAVASSKLTDALVLIALEKNED